MELSRTRFHLHVKAKDSKNNRKGKYSRDTDTVHKRGCSYPILDEVVRNNALRFFTCKNWLPKGKGGGGDTLGVWDEYIHTTICRIDNQQGPAI